MVSFLKKNSLQFEIHYDVEHMFTLIILTLVFTTLNKAFEASVNFFKIKYLLLKLEPRAEAEF